MKRSFVNQPNEIHKTDEGLSDVNPSCSPRCLQYVRCRVVVKRFHVECCPSRPRSPLASATSISTGKNAKRMVGLQPADYWMRPDLSGSPHTIDWPNITAVLDTVQPKSALRTLRSIAFSTQLQHCGEDIQKQTGAEEAEFSMYQRL